jgi:hypothetical protein
MMSILLAGASSPALATISPSITGFGVAGTEVFTQSSGSTPTTQSSGLFSAYLTVSSAGALGSVSATSSVNGVGPFSYTGTTASTSFTYQSGSLTPTQLSTYLTSGSVYTVSTSGGTLGSQNTNPDLSPMAFASSIPALNSASFTALQSFDPSQQQTLNFSGFSPHGGITSSSSSVIITRVSDGATVFSSGALSSASTSVQLGANVLSANTAYNFALVYSDMVSTVISSANGSPAFQGMTFNEFFNEQTNISFTTGSPAPAVPEPASLVMTGLGLAGALVVRARRRRNPK